MAVFRKLHVSFWSDSFTSELDRDKKLFYIYLLTNEHTTQCGIYEITKKQIAFDLLYSIDTVSKLLEYFIKQGKIKYNDKTNELAIGNWMKYNNSTSPKVKTCIDKEFKKVKDTVLIQYVNSIDTHPQEEEEKEEEEKNNNTWRTNFEIYKQELREAYLKIAEDKAWVESRKEYHPNVDILKSIEKVCVEYWSKEKGWKKKKASKTEEIDWPATFVNSLNFKENRVYEQNRK